MIKQCLILFISNIIFWIQRIGARAYTNILAAVVCDKKEVLRTGKNGTWFEPLLHYFVRQNRETLASLLLPSWPKFTKEKEKFLFSFVG